MSCEFGVLGHRSAGLARFLSVDENAAGEDERLGLSRGFGEPALDQQLIEPPLRAFHACAARSGRRAREGARAVAERSQTAEWAQRELLFRHACDSAIP